LGNTLPFPPKVILGYSKLNQNFTSGDLARQCDLPRSTAKYYVKKMIELHLVTKVPYKRLYQKYANALKFSSWMKDLLKIAVEPLENGDLVIPEDYGEE
jgi:DNA-binding IclR family transcriptional regulator